MYLFPRTVINTNLSYRLRNDLTVFADVINLTDEPQRWYPYNKGRPFRAAQQGANMTFGLKGGF